MKKPTIKLLLGLALLLALILSAIICVAAGPFSPQIPSLTRGPNDFASFTGKTTPANGDVFLIEDSAASGIKKSLTWANLVAGIGGSLPSGGSVGQSLINTGSGTGSWQSLTVSQLPPGTAGYLLTGNGTGSAPSYQAAPVSLPTQTGNSGDFLTTNGSSASWAQVPLSTGVTGTLPLANLTGGTSGYLLTGNGTGSAPSYQAAPISLPTQTGNSGDFLTTNGSSASWAQVPLSTGVTGTLPLANLTGGTSGYLLTGNGTGSAPSYVAQSTLSVGSASTATTATNLAGTTVGSIPYQSGSAATSYISDVAAGQPLLSGGTGTYPGYAGWYEIGTGGASYTYPGSSKTLMASDFSNDSGTLALTNLAGGTAGYVLTGNGTGSAPSYQAVSGLPSGGSVGELVVNTGSGTGTWQIPGVAAGQPMLSGGTGTAPAYAGYYFSGSGSQTYTFPTTSKTVMANDFSNASGVLPEANGGSAALSLNPTQSSGSPTPPAIGTTGGPVYYYLTVNAAITTFGAITGTPATGQEVIMGFQDDGSGPHAISGWDSSYHPVGTVLPTTTVVSKITYVKCYYNPAGRWDVLGVSQE